MCTSCSLVQLLRQNDPVHTGVVAPQSMLDLAAWAREIYLCEDKFPILGFVFSSCEQDMARFATPLGSWVSFIASPTQARQFTAPRNCLWFSLGQCEETVESLDARGRRDMPRRGDFTAPV